MNKFFCFLCDSKEGRKDKYTTSLREELAEMGNEPKEKRKKKKESVANNQQLVADVMSTSYIVLWDFI